MKQRKILAWLLAMSMVLTLLPMSAIAANSAVYVSTNGSDSGSGTESSPYATIAKAYENVAANGTIYLKSDLTQNSTATLNGSKTVTITSVSGNSVYSIKRSTAIEMFKVSNGTVNFTKIIIDGGNAELNANGISVSGGTVNLNTGATVQNFKSTTGEMKPVLVTGGSLNINAGSLIQNNNTYRPIVYVSNGEATLNGGTIKNNTSRDVGGIYISQGTLNLISGTVTGNTSTNNDGNVKMQSSSATVNVGSSNAPSTPLIITGNTGANATTVQNLLLGDNNATLTINGSLAEGSSIGVTRSNTSFSGNSKFATNANNTIAEYFHSDIDGTAIFYCSGTEDYVGSTTITSEGHTHSANSLWLSHDAPTACEAQIGTTYYSTLKSALSAANDNDEIKLLRDITVTSNINVSKTVTVTSGGDTVRTIYGKMDAQTKNTGIFTVSGNLTLTNITIDGTNMPKTGAWNGAIYVGNGTATLGDGATVQNFKWDGTQGGMAVLFVSGGTLNISDGAKVTGCNITGGASNNEASVVKSGSGGKIVMTGGEITGNTGCTSVVDTGTYNSPSFTMSGGKIAGNTTTGSFSAVCVRTTTNVYIGGNAYISGNTDKDDNQKNLYIKTGATVGLVSSLTGTIGVSAESVADGTLIAKGVDGYTAQASDAEHITSDSGEYGVVYNTENSGIYLSDASTKTWQTATDSGSYTDGDDTLGMMRFMFVFGNAATDESVTEYGIKYVNSNDFTDSSAKSATVKKDGNYTAFQGDIVGIKEALESAYYAKAYIVRNGITYWSNVVSKAVDWTRNFTDYKPGTESE